MKISRIIAFGFLIFCLSLSLNARELPKLLLNNPNIIKIDTLETNDFFKEKYLLTIKQLIDHKNPEFGSFEQRVFVSHYGFEQATVFVTEGYIASYAESAKHIDELAGIFKTNQIVVEHRYFGESVPETINYDYLTTENAANDHHSVYLLMKEIYKSK
ncbi:MAG: hypothetical protein GX879_08940 [Bacteroidales bacterium]|nr:hypothetical protein [Bacteroidales bacterium]